ncbi:TRAFs-binding domain-containing protein [Vibrio algarum]|uniref:TRAFs-binding domain-containing protein n=1 Tax=Vibrio algarum TaxID=3020714 RepID=A0ABT4YT19_9VIBR|nr:TRAFs-binding domain-containing protein [Vibrio sp. KJ40-1]MDB1124696.1 TRAFs-binding domain-containing protein [Vibrio sp. KJ40-1]
MKPYCFVLMPFGKKPDTNGRIIDFDSVYELIIKPAIDDASLTPIRADEEKSGGIIHKAMFERLMMCEYAIADLTTANANVFYELGVRHGTRPHSTSLIFSEDSRLPFDVSSLRGLPYKLDEQGKPIEIEAYKVALTEMLTENRNSVDDSPVYQLIHDMPRIEIDRLKTDTFRDAVEYEEEAKRLVASCRSQGVKSLFNMESDLQIHDTPPAILIDLLLSYRAVEAWQCMIDFTEKLPAPLSNMIMVREQLGFALNRLGIHNDAEKVLTELISQYGPSSETNGILGRVYKDLWAKHSQSSKIVSDGYLRKAINTYVQGFEADWRDAYPGINAITLMEMMETVDPRQAGLLPIVKFAVEQRLKSKQPDYWDYATLLELAVLGRERDSAQILLGDCLAEVRESWEPKTTAKNISFIYQARIKRGEDVEWVKEIENELLVERKNDS